MQASWLLYFTYRILGFAHQLHNLRIVPAVPIIQMIVFWTRQISPLLAWGHKQINLNHSSNTSGLFAKQFQAGVQYGARPDPVISRQLKSI